MTNIDSLRSISNNVRRARRVEASLLGTQVEGRDDQVEEVRI